MNDETLLPAELCEEIRTRVFGAGFIRLTQSLNREGRAFRISLRPVRLKGETFLQAEMVDDGRTQVRNLTEAAAKRGLEDILTQPGKRELHLITAEGDLHIRVTKKGKPLVARGKAKVAPNAAAAEPQAHDRTKRQPLTDFDSTALLRVLGLADDRGQVKASMRGKYDQVNALLRAVEPLLPETAPASFTVVDCGCGKAYLTLALQRYLTCAKQWPNVRVVGIDRNAEIIESVQAMANALGLDKDAATFQACTIAEADIPRSPDLVMSLHACDTATDDALIAAVRTQASRILCVPCCQHELHHALAKGGPMRAPLRHGILRERLADLLTDTFRAQVLRICGYRARVMEFVSQEATGRNILIRAERGLRPGLGEAIAEYRDLCAFWGVEPYIGKALCPAEDA